MAAMAGVLGVAGVAGVVVAALAAGASAPDEAIQYMQKWVRNGSGIPPKLIKIV
jgi:hypothetical protein